MLRSILRTYLLLEPSPDSEGLGGQSNAQYSKMEFEILCLEIFVVMNLSRYCTDSRLIKEAHLFRKIKQFF